MQPKPQTHQLITHQGFQTFVQITGDPNADEVLLFLHGNPDTHHLWDEVIAKLPPEWCMITVDLPGFGQSTAPENYDCHLTSMAAWLDAVLQQLVICKPINLIVHDFGGPYGLAWAVSFPEKVRRIMAIDTLFSAKYRWHFWARVWRTRFLGEVSLKIMNKTIFQFEMKRGARGLSKAKISEMFARITPETNQMILRLYRATDPEKLAIWDEQAKKIFQTKPSCVLWGAHDPYIDVKYAQDFGTDQVFIEPNSGHWLPAEAPDFVFKHLLQLLQRMA